MARKTTKFDGEKRSITILPKNDNQKDYIQALKSSDMTVVLGPAGTGKTYIAASFAASLYLTKKIDKIILTRPNIAAGRSIGYFPGSLEEKMAPWIAPVISVLVRHLGQPVVDTGIKNGNIQVVPFETMRGSSFDDSFILLDEAQNTTPHEMEMFLTRIGENSRVVVNGDVSQSDLKDDSGLKAAIRMVEKQDLPVPIVEFGVEDIVRSELCRMWVVAFIEDKKGTN